MTSATAPRSAWAAQDSGLKPRSGEWWFNTWSVQQDVWPLSQGAGVTVAMVDTGVQASVPDLRGVVVPGGDVTGRGGNGETDFNTVQQGHGHGTMMSVLIAGQGFGTGMVGVAPKVKILPVVVNSGTVDVTSSTDSIAAGIVFAANHGARVIAVPQVDPSSSSAGCDANLQTAVAYAISRNIVVVAPVGSTNLIGDAPSQPASCAGVLAVGAVGPNEDLWYGSTPEPYVDLVAPGSNLISSGSAGQLVTAVNGTRSASALAAAAAALIRSRYPKMPWNQVVQRLTATALAHGQVPNDSFGYGILRLYEAVNATAFPVSANAANPVYGKYLAWLATAQGRAVSKQLAASGTGGVGGAGGASGGARASASPRPSATAPSATRGAGASRMLRIGALAAILLVLGAVAFVVSRRKGSSGSPAPSQVSSARADRYAPPPPPSTGPPSTRPASTGPPPAPGSSQPYEPRPYRIPPYSPLPEPIPEDPPV